MKKTQLICDLCGNEINSKKSHILTLAQCHQGILQMYTQYDVCSVCNDHMSSILKTLIDKPNWSAPAGTKRNVIKDAIKLPTQPHDEELDW